jgi:hypothetical protein
MTAMRKLKLKGKLNKRCRRRGLIATAVKNKIDQHLPKLGRKYT